MSNHNYLASDDQNPDFVGASNPDNRLTVRFHREAVRNNFKSEQESRPIYDEVDMVTIHVPGDQLTAVTAIVREDHKKRFPQQWAIYQNHVSGDQSLAGKTPLEHWARLSKSQVAELKYMKFLAVEDVANASDAQLQAIGMCGGMTAHAFRDAAQRFLKVSADDTVAAKAEAALQAMKDQNQSMADQLAATNKAMEQMQAQFAALASQQSITGLEALAAASPAEVGKKAERQVATAKG